MLIYFAGPLFNQAERAFNAQLATKLEVLGYTIFLPQRDGIEAFDPAYSHMTMDERHQAIFALDREQIMAADTFLFILDGRVPDEGACVELGIAYAHKLLKKQDKLLIGLHTDARAAFPGAKLNAMIQVPLDHIVDNESDLLAVLEAHQA